MRSNSILNIENNDKYCFLWSILAFLQPCENSQSSTVKNYRQYFNELNIESFDNTNGFKCSDFHKVEKFSNLSINIFELFCNQHQNKWKHNLIPFAISKNDADKVVDLLIYKNHYALIEKLKAFLRNHNKNFKYKRCLNSYKSEKMLLIQKQNCKIFDITSTRTSSDSDLHCKNHFHKNPTFFTIIAKIKPTMKLIFLVEVKNN